jgi:hypothetical protein
MPHDPNDLSIMILENPHGLGFHDVLEAVDGMDDDVVFEQLGWVLSHQKDLPVPLMRGLLSVLMPCMKTSDILDWGLSRQGAYAEIAMSHLLRRSRFELGEILVRAFPHIMTSDLVLRIQTSLVSGDTHEGWDA